MKWRWALFAISLASCRCGGGDAPKPETRASAEDARVQAVVAKENAEQAVTIAQLTTELEEKKAQLKAAEDRVKHARTGPEKGLALVKVADLQKKVADLQARIDAARGDATTD
jgi:hypothetical protein